MAASSRLICRVAVAPKPPGWQTCPSSSEGAGRLADAARPVLATPGFDTVGATQFFSKRVGMPVVIDHNTTFIEKRSSGRGSELRL